MKRTPRQAIAVSRDVQGIVIPSGEAVRLYKGSEGFLTQAAGGSYTVLIDGSLFKIAGVDGDAICQPAIAAKAHSSNPSDEELQAIVWSELREVYDPEIPCSIVDLGLIYKCEFSQQKSGFKVDILMTVTAPGCGMGESIARDVAARIEAIPRVVDYVVEVVYDPPWERSMMSMEARLRLGML